MMHGLVHDSMIVGTAKHIAHAGHPKRRRKLSDAETIVIAVLTVIVAIIIL